MADFMGLMKQAAEFKSKMEAMQAELDQIEVEGTAGGNMVAVTLSGKGDLRHTRIDDSLFKPDQKEIVEDLIVAAHADAKRKLEAMLAEKMQALTGGLPLPPGLKSVLTGRGGRRTGDRTPDPAAGAPARARPALGTARGACI